MKIGPGLRMMRREAVQREDPTPVHFHCKGWSTWNCNFPPTYFFSRASCIQSPSRVVNA